MSELVPTPELPDDTPIREVSFPPRIKDALSAAGIKTVGEVRETADETLVGLPDIGRASVTFLSGGAWPAVERGRQATPRNPRPRPHCRRAVAARCVFLTAGQVATRTISSTLTALYLHQRAFAAPESQSH
jgi:Bacterial RNA polymerase, alpha chain C terminal domain